MMYIVRTMQNQDPPTASKGFEGPNIRIKMFLFADDIQNRRRDDFHLTFFM